ncbi:MAG TPA: putative porin [Verrucomicrobiae bacterium]|nr:putative porin [Verrucomicrobiae bacterium]
MALGHEARAQTADPLLNALIKKGILTQQDAEALQAKMDANALHSDISKWKISKGIKSIELFGDIRFRYEYRSAEAVDNAGHELGSLIRDRLRYALRFGVRGDLLDNFYFGLRMETSQNSRSPWVTFADESSFPFPGPSSKTSDGLNVGQVYLGWRPAEWADITVGRMPNLLYTTPMLWDTDICPEGLTERFKFTVDGGDLDLFANFGQFIYQDLTPDHAVLGIFPASAPTIGGTSNIPFLLAWQIGANYRFQKSMSVKVMPTVYNYTGRGQNGVNTGFPDVFVGAGNGAGANGFSAGASPSAFTFNQTGINDLFIFDLPAEYNFTIGKLNARAFGDFAINLDGDRRAANAALFGGFPKQTGEDKAYQFGLGLGNCPRGTFGPSSGVVYGNFSKKGAWEARAYWQHVEQYALDVNLIDSDVFEGRGNLEGVYGALGYCISDNIIATLRCGYADRINKSLGTGGSNQDLPWINPVTKYKLLQFDLTYRF